MTEANRARCNGTLLWGVVFLGVLLWSAYKPHGTFIWFLEAVPALVAAGLLALTKQRFTLTPLTYGLILVHSVILMVGAKYTYAEVPLFDWLAEAMGSSRNNYDKVGHFAQGFRLSSAASFFSENRL